MDAKVTLSFDKNIIQKAKDFAASQGISLSRLTEYIYREMTAKHYEALDELPISEWVYMVAEGETEYKRTPSRKNLKSEFYEKNKK